MLDKTLQTLLSPAVNALGYELVGVERLPRGKLGALVRVIIDCEAGIRIEDCEKVSYQISGILEVEDPIKGQYTLEVSSPGLDRPLFTLEHYQRFIGSAITLRLLRPLGDRRNFTGILQAVENDTILLLAEDVQFTLPYANIEKANLVPELKKPTPRSQ